MDGDVSREIEMWAAGSGSLQLTEVILDSEAFVAEEAAELSAVIDRLVGTAAINRCGVRITYYANGDIVAQVRKDVKFGIIEEKQL